jgi:hypothetical protein
MKKILIQYGVCVFAVRSNGAVGAGAAGRIAIRLGKRCRNAFREIQRARARYVGQVRLETGPGRSLWRCVQPDRYGEPHARRRAFWHTEYGAKPAPITDPEKLQEALKVSYIDLRLRLSENDLQVPVKLFRKRDD